jgi:hypothetical protein
VRSGILGANENEPTSQPKKASVARRVRAGHIRIIQQLLWHAKLETTQVYTEVSIKLLQDVHARTHPASQAAGDAA